MIKVVQMHKIAFQKLVLSRRKYGVSFYRANQHKNDYTCDGIARWSRYLSTTFTALVVILVTAVRRFAALSWRNK